MSDRNILLAEIDAFRRRHGTSETRFGREALNDGHFVRRLREGGNITLRTVEKVRAFMARQDSAASAAAPPRPVLQQEAA
jgi:hypothetical protein